MRTFALFGWLLIPVVVGAYHYGPGQERLRLDEAAALLAQADRDASAERWPEAVEGYSQALGLMPADRVREARQVRLERARARMFARQLPEASEELGTLVEELQDDRAADARQLTEARAALANAQYYMTWLMRLEGLGRDEWDPVIESARQTFRLLAEQATQKGDEPDARRWSEDLESVIRLARMEPGELQGLALPKQCQGCKSGQCKGKRPGRNPNAGQQKPKDARGASSGPPPDGSGS